MDTSLYQFGGASDISADGTAIVSTAIVGTALKAGVQIGWRAIIDSKFP